MQYILTREEYDLLIPKSFYDEKKDELEAVVNALRSTDFCIQHKYGKNCYCDDCPIASLNLKQPEGKNWKPCKNQHFSK